MFQNATNFNQPLNHFKTNNLTALQNTFYNATSFDQDLSNRNVEKVSNFTSTFANVKLSPSNYNALLSSRSQQNVQN
jgi:hypothetical protein